MQPIVPEDEWLRLFQNANPWYPPAKPTVVVAPHPDDETLSTGGLIAEQRMRGLPVTVIAVTDGEAAYTNSTGLSDTRQAEQEQAVRKLGADNSIIRLRLPDSNLAAHEADLAHLLASTITAEKLVLAPWIGDWHPDHEACGRATRSACEQSGAELIYYFFWTWHQRRPEVFHSLSALRFELSPSLQCAKQEAVACHHSQLIRNGEPPILPDLLLAPARRPFEIFVSHA